MYQDQYVQALRPIVHKDLVGNKAEETVSEQISKLFLSLLMALAYALMTRVITGLVLNRPSEQNYSQMQKCKVHAFSRKL